MTLEDKVHGFRLHLFRRAQELGNVSAACGELGVSRSLYYQLRKCFQRYGADGLHPTRRRGRPGRLRGDEKLKTSARVQIEGIGLDHRVEGEIALS